MKRARMPGDETGQCAVTDCRALTRRTKQAGVDLFAERHNLAFYDALIAASALLADCDQLWSEDMQDGMAIDGRLQITNPFRELRR